MPPPPRSSFARYRVLRAGAIRGVSPTGRAREPRARAMEAEPAPSTRPRATPRRSWRFCPPQPRFLPRRPSWYRSTSGAATDEAGAFGLAGVHVKPAPRLPAEVARSHHLAKQRARAVLRVAEPLLKHLHDG